MSSSTNDAGGYGTSAAGTSFANLKGLGLPFLFGVDPNTRIDLPGVGYVVLNEQRSSVTASSASLRMTAIRAVVTEVNLLGFDLGTTVLVARAQTGLSAPTGGFLGGFAYGTAAKVGGPLTSSPSFRVSLACAGTNGVVKERNGAGINVPGVVNSGTIRDTAVGQPRRPPRWARRPRRSRRSAFSTGWSRRPESAPSPPRRAPAAVRH